jgi:gamma-tubulin complex component 3
MTTGVATEVHKDADKNLVVPSPFPSEPTLQPSNDMMMLCGTLGMYVRYIQQFVYHHHHYHHPNSTSAILRAFRIAVQIELRSYLQYIANVTIPTTTTIGQSSTQLRQPQSQHISSIQELIYHIYPYFLRFKSLVLIISSSCCVDDDGTAKPTIRNHGECTEESSISSVAGVHLLSFLYRHLQRQYYDAEYNNHNNNNNNNNNNHPNHRQSPLVSNLLKSTVQPWLVMLYRWIMDGIISSNEFFITTIHHHSHTSTGASIPLNTRNEDDRYLWQYRYRIQTSHIPHIGWLHTPVQNGYNDNRHRNGCNYNDLVELIFIIGKGVNYIRQCLHDSSWSLLSQLSVDDETFQHGNLVETTTTAAASSSTSTTCFLSMEQMGFTYDSIVKEEQQQQPNHRTTILTSKLRWTLDRSALLVHRHILSHLRSEFHLLHHLTVLKQFMLFGQGDFYTSFLDSIYEEYPSKQHRTTGMIGIYRHHLSNLFESSIKTTNAVLQFPTHILDRLDIDFLLDRDDYNNYMSVLPNNTNSSNANRIPHTIWDTLVLKYNIPDPMVAILHDDAMVLYRSIFVHLLRINHTEYRLHTTWRDGLSIYRSLQKNAQYLAITVNTNADYQQAVRLLRTISVSRQSMIHFTSTLKGYIMSEAIECGWKRLLPIIHNAGTLDEVISAHDTYLQNIVMQIFCPVDTVYSRNVGRVGQIIDHIRSLLQLVQDFCDMQEELFDDTTLAIERAETKRRCAEQLAKQGSWGFHREREAADQESCFGLSDITKSVAFDGAAEQFRLRMISLVQELDDTLNGNLAVNASIKTPTKSLNGTEYASNDEIEEYIDFEALRFLASQLNFNGFCGVTIF